MNTRMFVRARRSLVLFAIAAQVASSSAAVAQIPLSEYATRRAAVVQGLPSGVVVAFGSPAPEHDYSWFYQNSRFSYLTGFGEPEAALVMVVKDGAIDGRPIFFLQPKDPAREVWEGNRLGVDSARVIYGFDARPDRSMNAVIDSLFASGAPKVLHVVGDYNATRPIRTWGASLLSMWGHPPGYTARRSDA